MYIPLWSILAWYGLVPVGHVIMKLRFNQPLTYTRIKGGILTQTVWAVLLPLGFFLLAIFGSKEK